jgi:CcmD family protein
MSRLSAPLVFLPLLAPALAAAEESPVGAPPPSTLSTNLTWVMIANLVIWGGIAAYVFWLHRRAATLERKLSE